MTIVCAQQLAPAIGDLDSNRALTRDAIAQAVGLGAEIVVLPELITCGYMLTDAEEAARVALAPGEGALGDWARAAAERGIVVAGGFCERGDDGRVYNSAAVYDPSGLRAVYRKLHLWDREKLVFTAGDELPPVLDTPLGRLALMICYDLEFPELTRSVALAGAELLLVPTNWPLNDRPDGERPAEATIAMATARINHMAVVCADRLGTERGQEWTGGTTIVDADGWVAAETRRAEPAVADIDLDRARDKRFTELADAFADRRPELYGSVAAGPDRR